MANVFIQEKYVQDIADAIRFQLKTSDTYKPYQMAKAILSITGGASGGGGGGYVSFYVNDEGDLYICFSGDSADMNFVLDEEGNLYYESDFQPEFELDENGNLYYITDEEGL